MTTLTFKVTEPEARRIRKQAKRENLTVSEYLRRRVGGLSNDPAKPGLVKCAFTGAMIFAPLTNQPPLTTESVREIMADFP